MKEKIKQKGFIQIPLLIAIIASIIAVSTITTGLVLYKTGKLSFHKQTIPTTTPSPTPTPVITPTSTPAPTPTPSLSTPTPIPTPKPTPPPTPIPTSTPTPTIVLPIQYTVNTSIEDYGNASAIKITVSGGNKALNAVLSDPNGTTVDSKYISSNDMLDGVETFWLHFQNYQNSNPKLGNYKLIIKESVGAEIFRKVFAITGGKPIVTNYSASWKAYYPDTPIWGYKYDKFYLTIRNEGDLTFYIHDITVSIGGTNLFTTGPLLSKRTILVGETATLQLGDIQGGMIIYAGNYLMEVKVIGWVNGVDTTYTTYTSSITVP